MILASSVSEAPQPGSGEGAWRIRIGKSTSKEKFLLELPVRISYFRNFLLVNERTGVSLHPVNTLAL